MAKESMLEQAWSSGFVLCTVATVVFIVAAFDWFLRRGR